MPDRALERRPFLPLTFAGYEAFPDPAAPGGFVLRRKYLNRTIERVLVVEFDVDDRVRSGRESME